MRDSMKRRRLTLTCHVIFSVGWLGAVLAYLALAVIGMVGRDSQQAAFSSMELVGWFVIMPLAIAALVSGLFQSLTTEWGLFRHYWVSVKLGLTILATLLLIAHMPVVRGVASGDLALAAVHGGHAELQFVLHAVGGLIVLILATALSIYKPWGLTAFGRRRGREWRSSSQLQRRRGIQRESP